jgi:hypothetical protein
MSVRLHPHAKERLSERGASEEEIITAMRQAKRSRQSLAAQVFRRNFAFGGLWKGKVYATKQVEVYAVQEGEDWLAITFVTRDPAVKVPFPTSQEKDGHLFASPIETTSSNSHVGWLVCYAAMSSL